MHRLPRFTLCQLCVLSALVALTAILATACGATPVSIQGTVIDATTGQPIPGARVQSMADAKPVTLDSDQAGRYRLERLTAGTTVTITAQRYQEASFVAGKGGEIKTALPPLALHGTVRDSLSGKPLARATVAQGTNTATADEAGNYRLVGFLPGQPVRSAADGYEAKESAPQSAGQFDIQLRPNTVSGRVLDAASRKPVPGASVTANGVTTTADGEGRFVLRDLPENVTLRARAPGYDPAKAEVAGATSLDLTLQPFVVRAAYLTYYGVADAGLRTNVVRLIEQTELNAVVIDIKGDFGRLAYKSEVPLARAIGADREPTIGDVQALLRDLKARGIYTIARFVVFKDDVLGRNGAKAGLDVAVRNASTGGPWIDGEDLVWVDPFRQEVWQYNVDLAVEAAKKGFDEIQFDYIRFPTDPSPGSTVNAAVFSKPSTEANRVAAIEGFLAKAREALQPFGTSISADVFGYTCWRDDDMGIGQKIEVVAKYVDFLAPMVYPSTYSDGLPMTPEFRDAPAYPYEIVYYSVKKAVGRLRGMAVKVRPWLQYFDDYPWASGRRYEAQQVEAQIRAGTDAGGLGYMLWDPTNRFARGGLAPQ